MNKKDVSEEDLLDDDDVLAETGNFSDFVLGFALGFFFGVVMILWTWNPVSPRLQRAGYPIIKKWLNFIFSDF